MFDLLAFILVVAVIFDTLAFSGHYRKTGWQQLTNQTSWVSAAIR